MSSKPKLKVYYTDFWPVFDINNNYFTNLLTERFNVVLDKESPDILFYSVFGINHLSYTCKKIFYTGENIRPNFDECDFAFSFDYPHDYKNYRLPLYPIFGNPLDLTKPKPSPEDILAEKTKFCNFIYSNPANPIRNEFFHKLNKYKKVDSGGRLFNNIQERIKNKLDFIRDYKFTIAFENESYPGYQTEKIFEPMLVHSLPIYWGNTLAEKDFNTNSFIYAHKFLSLDDLVEHIIEVDNNDDLYMKYLSETYFTNNELNEFVKKENILNRLEAIVNSDIEPIGKSLDYNSENPRLRKNSRRKAKLDWESSKIKHKIRNFSFLKLQIKLKRMFGN